MIWIRHFAEIKKLKQNQTHIINEAFNMQNRKYNANPKQ